MFIGSSYREKAEQTNIWEYMTARRIWRILKRQIGIVVFKCLFTEDINTLKLEKITGKNVWDILKLRVSEKQKSFVASNDISMIEAYISITGNGYAFPFGIYEDDVPIGFLMIGFDTDDYWDDAPLIAKGNYNLWRLMIDHHYQNKGYGKEAVRLALEFIKTFPCGEAEYCWLSYEPENEVARQLYHSFGFVETGEMDGEELVAVLKL